MTELDPRLHFVVATAIIVKDNTFDSAGDVAEKATRFLIAKRASHEKAFPNKWTVPGGKLVLHEYSHLPKTSPNHPQWYNVVDWVLRKEVKEEVGLEIHKPQYLCDLVFVRPDGYPVVTLSYWCRYKSGNVKLCKDLTDHAWVTLEEAKNYDLIDGIWDELREVDKQLRKV
jgi:8-oxo-dGTP pyrophosphatase MutT (NUDIX family)